MPASVLGRPGTPGGPCDQPCGHRQCAELRKIADSCCRHCRRPIGYVRPFYLHPKGFIHADCPSPSGGIVYGGRGYWERYD